MQAWHIRFLLRQLVAMLLLLDLSRVLFFLFNYTYFSNEAASTLPLALLKGLRFDLSALLLLNGFYILLFLLPFSYRFQPKFIKAANILFIAVNAAALLLDSIDWAFFRFTHKRLSGDFFGLFSAGDDMQNLLPVYVKQYWFILLIWGIFVFVLVKVTRINTRQFLATPRESIRLPLQLVYLAAGVSLTIVGMRGGLQLRPVEVSTAIQYTSARNIPLFINTPFSILKSWQKKGIEPVRYMAEKEAEQWYQTNHPGSAQPFQARNVVIIILESFSKEYVGFLNKGKGYTPFLDSLMSQGLVFPNAYANAKRSIEGIPAIVAGIPAWMEQPFIFSVYQSNEITSLANTLKTKGYYSSFFHGGANGTMNFDSFTRLAGFDQYYGKNEFNNPADYDGRWGIYDEPFLQYFARQLNSQRTPFFSVLFTLSSHHPYSIPAQYKDRFPKGTLEIHESIGYTDYALKRFFEAARKMPWFSNTLFVITADHTSLSKDDFYSNRIGSYQVPMLYYMPAAIAPAVNSRLTQHIDVLPTVLDFLHYNQAYFAFGNNAFDSTGEHFAMNFVNNTWEFVEDTLAVEFDGNETVASYNTASDSLLQKPLGKTSTRIENKIKAIIQTYNSRLTGNRMK